MTEREAEATAAAAISAGEGSLHYASQKQERDASVDKTQLMGGTGRRGGRYTGGAV